MATKTADYLARASAAQRAWAHSHSAHLRDKRHACIAAHAAKPDVPSTCSRCAKSIVLTPSKLARREYLCWECSKGRYASTKNYRVHWRGQNSDKVKAHKEIYRALRAGEIVEKSCEKCGAQKAEAHHPDYTKPLDVEWLCRRHHAAVHYPRRA